MGWMSLSFDNLFVFETPRMVQIRDKWLGVPRFLLLLSIVLYIVLYETFLNEGYLLKEQPKGIVVSSLRRGEHHVPEALPYYCSTSAAMPDGTGPPCEFLDDLGVLLGEGNGGDPPEMGSMFITTRVSVSDSAVVPGCQRAFYSAEGKGGKVVLRNHDGEVCPEVPGYSKAAQRDYYVGDIEHFTIMFRHAIFGFLTGHVRFSTDVTGHAVFHVFDNKAPEGALQATRSDKPYAPESDINFLPRVSSSADVLKQLAQHGHVGYTHGDILTVERLLDCLGLGAHVLDLPSPEGAAAECDAPVSDLAPHTCPDGCYWVGPYCEDAEYAGPAECLYDDRCFWDNETATCKVVEEHGHCVPKTMRYDGFVVLVTIEYSTPRWHSFDDVGYRYVAQVVPGAEFRAVQKTVTADGHFRFYNRHGIRVVVLQTGYVSMFSFIELLKTLVGGAALLAVADRLTELLMRVLPRHHIYRSFKYVTSQTLSDIKVSPDNPWGPLTADDFAVGTLAAPKVLPTACDAPISVIPPPKAPGPQRGSGSSIPRRLSGASGAGSTAAAHPGQHLTPPPAPLDSPTATPGMRGLDAADAAAVAYFRTGGGAPATSLLSNPLGAPGRREEPAAEASDGENSPVSSGGACRTRQALSGPRATARATSVPPEGPPPPPPPGFNPWAAYEAKAREASGSSASSASPLASVSQATFLATEQQGRPAPTPPAPVPSFRKDGALPPLQRGAAARHPVLQKGAASRP
eukprot:TRINITY_DN3464_c0_g1_i1.p1 TRINITY_DN3464_c0_g1~~TRINITY_DN3464_c0_g1_i1.p1  ORF type:complete len:742 (+),score=197.18 TRINITY_DN3464_c0_g1_i1:119-2344(+)